MADKMLIMMQFGTNSRIGYLEIADKKCYLGSYYYETVQLLQRVLEMLQKMQKTKFRIQGGEKKMTNALTNFGKILQMRNCISHRF